MCKWQEQQFSCGHNKVAKVKCADHKNCNKVASAKPEDALPLNFDCDGDECGDAIKRRIEEGLIKPTDMSRVRGWETENEREEGQAWSTVNVRRTLEPRIATWAQNTGAVAGSSGGGGGGGGGGADEGVVGDAGALVVYGQDPTGQDSGQASWQASAGSYPHVGFDPTAGFAPDVGFAPNAGLAPNFVFDPSVGFDPDAGQPSGSGPGDPREAKSPKKDRKGKGKEKGNVGNKGTDRHREKDSSGKKDAGKGKKKKEK